MKLIYFTVTLFLLNHYVYSKINFYDAKTIDVLLGFGKTTSSSFYNLNGDIISELKLNYSDEQMYLFNYYEYSYDLNINYHFTDRLFFNVSAPLKYYTLTEITDTVYFGDDNSQYTKKIKIGDYSLFQPEYFKFGTNFILLKKDSSIIATNLDFFIPPGFHKGLYDDPDYNFLSDGAFQINFGLLLMKEFKKGWIETQINYRYKAEDFIDDITISTEVGLSTVPGTALSTSLEFIQSLGDFTYAREFAPKETTSQFNSLAAGFNFLIFFDEHVYSNFSYKVNLIGKNLWNYGGYNINLGVKL